MNAGGLEGRDDLDGALTGRGIRQVLLGREVNVATDRDDQSRGSVAAAAA